MSDTNVMSDEEALRRLREFYEIVTDTGPLILVVMERGWFPMREDGRMASSDLSFEEKNKIKNLMDAQDGKGAEWLVSALTRWGLSDGIFSRDGEKYKTPGVNEGELPLPSWGMIVSHLESMDFAAVLKDNGRKKRKHI